MRNKFFFIYSRAAMIYPNDSFNSKMTLEAVSKNKVITVEISIKKLKN